MNKKWDSTITIFSIALFIFLILVVLFAFSPILLRILLQINERFEDRISVSIMNSSKTVSHKVTLKWKMGEKKFTISPSHTTHYEIRKIGENSILLYVNQTGKTHALTGYICSRPFGSIEVELDSKGLKRSRSSIKNFFFEIPEKEYCVRDSCLYSLPKKSDIKK